MNDEIIGNLTTVIKTIILTVLPYMVADVNMQNQLLSIIMALVGLLIAYLDAKYPNTFGFLDNNRQPVQVSTGEFPLTPLNDVDEEPILNDDYIYDQNEE